LKQIEYIAVGQRDITYNVEDKMSRYIDTKDIAKLIRRDLKAEMPGVKFSVNMSRYSMGSSIRMTFKNGGDETPENKAKAREISDRYQGKTFCGMTDSESFVPIMVDGEECSSGCYVFVDSSFGYMI